LSQSFKPHEYLVVSSESEASELLRKKGDKARIIAGGTGIYEVAHRGLFSDVECLVDVSGLKLSYIHREDGTLHLGACTTMTTIFENHELSRYPALGALYDALRAIQPLQVKNVATVGGAICTALPFFDLPIALIALDTNVVLAPNNRTVSLLDFVQGFFAVDLKSGEFVKEVVIPLSEKAERIGSSFLKFALTGDDWAIINCSVRVTLDDGDEISSLRMCFGGGVGEKPVRVTRVEELLSGVNWNNQQKITKILEEHLPRELETITDLKASSKYRKRLAKVLAGRSIERAGRLASGEVS
jgi:CO/xanthine dehydrogenase FAD-binding subunit